MKNILAISLVCIIGIGLILLWYQKIKSQKIQNKECIIGKNKKLEGIIFGGCVDYWHISHLVLWFIVGKLSPNYHFIVVIVSVLWELFEHFCFKNYKKCKSIFCGRFEDIVLNILGYSIGSII